MTRCVGGFHFSKRRSKMSEAKWMIDEAKCEGNTVATEEVKVGIEGVRNRLVALDERSAQLCGDIKALVDSIVGPADEYIPRHEPEDEATGIVGIVPQMLVSIANIERYLSRIEKDMSRL
jgi:hypothetical protein